MPVTRDQAEQIATLAAAMRPHGARQWDHPGIVHAIHRVQHLALADVAMAAIRAAADRNLHTPAPIADTRSSAWRERLTDPAPTKATYCPAHNVQLKAGICPSCRADQLAADTPTPPRRGLPADQITSIVSELRDIAHTTTTHQEDPR